MFEEYLCVDGGGVHKQIAGLGGQHSPNHRRYRHSVEARDRGLQYIQDLVILSLSLFTRRLPGFQRSMRL